MTLGDNNDANTGTRLNIPHNILFDNIPSENNFDINYPQDDVEILYNIKTKRVMLQIYMGLLLCQYILIFTAVPFENVTNRPSIMICAIFYDIFMFTVCACILPLGSLAIPTGTSLRYLLVSSYLQAIGLSLGIWSTVVGLNTTNMTLYEYDPDTRTSIQVDTTTYIQVIACIAMFFHSLAFMVSLCNTIMCWHTLTIINNRLDRSSRVGDNFMEKQLPMELRNQVLRSLRG